MIDREDMLPDEVEAGYEHIVPFVKYNLDGRVTGTGTQGLFFILDFARQGHLIMPGEGHWDTHYVELSDGEIRRRPVLVGEFDTLTPASYAEATFRNLPPADVVFTGPTSGTQEHTEAGDLMIGWTIPGTYEVTITAFPHLPRSFTFEVS